MDKKISQLDPAAALDGTELLAVVQGGSTLKSTISAINTYLTGIFTPLTRQLTINGTTYDLSANRSWTVDTLPSQSGQNGKYLTTDGATASWATISTAVETLAQTLGAGNTSGAYDILMNTNQRIGFKDGDNINTSYISNNQTTAGSRTAYLPLFDGQLAYHATGVPLTQYYSVIGGANGALSSSTILRDNGTTLAVNSTTHVSTAALKIKGRLIVSTQEVTANDNYNAMIEVGVGNGVLFSDGTNGATGNNQLGYIFGDGGLQIYGRNNSSATKFFFSGKSSANRYEFYSDDANTHFKMTSTGVLNYTQVVNNDGFNIIRSNAATTTAAAYSALSVINADSTANRISIIGFTYTANVARNGFIGARFIDDANGDLFLGAKAATVEFIGATLYSNSNFGIGTSSSATARLHIKGSTSDSTAYALKVEDVSNNPLLYVRNDGNVGIGISTPTEKLSIFSGTITGLNLLRIKVSTNPSALNVNDANWVSINSDTRVGTESLYVNGTIASGEISIAGTNMFRFGGSGFSTITSPGLDFVGTMNGGYQFNGFGTLPHGVSRLLSLIPQSNDGAIARFFDDVMTVRTIGNISTQRGVIINSTTLHGSAILQIDSTTQGVLLPRMTTAQRDAIATPASGLEIYNTSTTSPNYYDGTTWQQVTNKSYVDTNIVSAQVPARLFNYYNFI